MLKNVKVPPWLEPPFSAAEDRLNRIFARRTDDPSSGTIEIDGERYILVRAASMSVDMFETIAGFYQRDGEGQARDIAYQVLFDIAHAIGKQDARHLHERLHLTDPAERLACGPVHMALAGWATADLLDISTPTIDGDFFLAYDHLRSFEADSWLAAGKHAHAPVCVMNAGYSAGFSEASLGVRLVAMEVMCRARGDQACRFLMAHPDRIERRLNEYMGAVHRMPTDALRKQPGFFRREAAEQKMREQQSLTTQIIETIPMRVFWKDRDLRYLGCNTAFARDAGRERPADLVGRDDFELGWREQAEAYRADDREVMDSDTPKLSFDEPQTTAGGARIWLRTSKVPLHNEDQQVVGVLGIYEDITTWKQTELSLQESESRFRLAFENSAIGMALVGVDGRWLRVNDALCGLLGYAPQELLSASLQQLTHADDLAADLTLVNRLLAGEVPHYQMEKRYLHHDGHVVWARVNVSLVRDSQGLPVHFVVQVADITDEKQIEDRIRRLNEELELKVQERTRQLRDAQDELMRREKLSVLGQVAGSVGHELRNPLGVMNNAVYFLQTVLSDADDTTKEYLGIIKDEIATANRIVSDLLDSVRIKPPQPERVLLGELIERTLRKVQALPAITVQVVVGEGAQAVRADPLQLHQVLHNLFTNAVDAMPGGGSLEIRCAAADGGVAVTVHDTGTGIAPEHLGKLFQPLFTTKARGIGLGLVVVKNLTEANGGTVAVASEPGMGTTFTLTLPAGDRASA